MRVDNLLKAASVFERFRVDREDDRDEAGAIQAFAFCYNASLFDQ